jgi:hypothetical protein
MNYLEKAEQLTHKDVADILENQDQFAQQIQ